MKLRKIALLAAVAALPLSGCSLFNKGVEVGGANKIQIRAYKAGYGVDWLNELITKFKAQNPDIDVDVVEASPSAGETALQELKVPNKNQIDLYFLANSEMYTVISQSQSILRNPNAFLYEDLTDVYNSKAIGFDGQEESKTIKERMFNGFEEYSTYNGHVIKANGKMFKLPWADGVLGIAANKNVLESYNIDYHDIVTSKDFVDVVERIYADGKKPFAWAGNNAPGYWSYLYETWFSQYSGKEAFTNFMKCAPNGDESKTNIKNNGYKVYEDEGILKSLQEMDKILNMNYSIEGANGMLHTAAQTSLVTGKAAFMVTGDWLLNEMKQNYYNEAKTCVMLKTPIISSVIDHPDCSSIADEAELKALVKAIDAGSKSLSGEGYSVEQKAFDHIYEARSSHDSLGVKHDIVIPSYADAKEAAKKFVRYLYSEDGCRLFAQYANANLPLSYTSSGDETDFQKSIKEIYNFDTVNMISGEGDINEIRNLSLMRLLNYPSWTHPNTFKAIINDKYDAEHAHKARAFTPESMFEQEKTYMKDQWVSNFMVKAGY